MCVSWVDRCETDVLRGSLLLFIFPLFSLVLFFHLFLFWQWSLHNDLTYHAIGEHLLCQTLSFAVRVTFEQRAQGGEIIGDTPCRVRCHTRLLSIGTCVVNAARWSERKAV